jgi:serine/threonine-protein kinase
VEYCTRDGHKLPPLPGHTRGMFDPLVGQTIDGRYIMESLLGEGGMGYVYAARHAIIDKRVAIKVLRKEAAQDEAAAQRFIIEAKAASRIGHQNIVDITDFGVLPTGNAYFVMEFLDGPTLGKLMREHGRVPPLRAIRICTEVARGLHAAHQKSIIHRDLKPENIFVLSKDADTDGIKIVDFGIAKDVKAGKRLTAVGMVLGTPEYMSPEQATGQESDHHVDQYALGCILYEMLTGDVPFKGENAPKTLTMHVFDPVVPPSQRCELPGIVEDLVLKMLQKRPVDRYADMRELIAAFEDAEQELVLGTAAPRRSRSSSLTVRPGPPNTDFFSLPRTRAPLFVAAGVGAAALILIGIVAVTQLAKPSAPSTKPKPVAPPPVVSAPQPPAPPAPAVEIELQVTTQPEGAEVFDGAERLGLTPLTLKRPRVAEPMSVTVRRAGFKDVTRPVALDRDQAVDIVLTPKRDKVAERTTRSPSKTQSTAVQPPAQPPTHHVTDLRNPFE